MYTCAYALNCLVLIRRMLKNVKKKKNWQYVLATTMSTSGQVWEVVETAFIFHWEIRSWETLEHKGTKPSGN